LLTLWFLLLEKGRMGEKMLPSGDGAAGSVNLLPSAA
jgi:hypothetical protein